MCFRAAFSCVCLGEDFSRRVAVLVGGVAGGGSGGGGGGGLMGEI